MTIATTILQTAVSWPRGMIYGQVGLTLSFLADSDVRVHARKSVVYTALGRRDQTSENDASRPHWDHKTVSILVDS